MARIPVQLTPGEADTLGAAVALLERLEREANHSIRRAASPWDGMAIGQARTVFEHAAQAVTKSLIELEVSGDCPEAKRVLGAMDPEGEPAAEVTT